MCFAQIGLNLRQFSKTFHFSLTSRAHTLSCLPLSLLKPPLSLTKPPFSSSILHQSSRKRYEFSLIFNVFQVSSPSFLGFCVYVEIWKYDFVDVLMSTIYGFCWYNAYFTCFTCLFFILMHCTMLCVVCACHVHDKMSLRCFCVSLWIPLSTKIVGIILFP